MSGSHSPPRARPASPRRAPSASPAQPDSPHADACEFEDLSVPDPKATHEEKVRFYLAQLDLPDGFLFGQDDSLLNADELRAKLGELRRRGRAMRVWRKDIESVAREERARNDATEVRRDALSTELARLQEELAQAKAELAQGKAEMDEKLHALLDSVFGALP
ncbi:hypothetical protein J4E83_004097 [Alternaria metachromatica]|uniref:uncharacterized protein n=1 Tax=Alternaria metachromatica TaxID=283354 RepID=UPI0020C51B39|nr:uncharacterized protein J4E83_004097 [Alternaria metachromatica]KAI4624423.1 hypothetical protein J4E83_004097 [Alternaria metachromatica]